MQPRAPIKWFWNAGWLLLSLASLFWAGNAVVGRAVSESVPPMGLSFWRWVVAAALLAPLAWPHLKRDWPELRKAWLVLAALAAFGLSGFTVLFYLALHSTTAINSVLLQSVTPPLILAFSFLIFRERAGWPQLAGLVVSLAGVAVIVAEGEPSKLQALRLNLGDGLVMLAVVGYALYSTLLRRAPRVHALSLLAVLALISIAFLAPLYAVEHLRGEVMAPDVPTLASLAYVAIFPSMLSYLFYNRGVELMGANRAGQFVHLMPAFGAILAVLFLGEALRLFHLAGGVLIGAGIALASRKGGVS